MEDNKKWTVIETEYVMRNTWLTVRRDHIRQPSGVEIKDYWVLEYPEWGNVIAITTDGRMVMERQYRHAMGRTAFEICAGCAEPGEDPLAAAKRELREETGYTGGEWRKIMTISPNGTSMTNMTHCFVALGVVEGRSQPEVTEDIDVMLMTPDEVLGLLGKGEIVQATMAAPLWRFFFERKV